MRDMKSKISTRKLLIFTRKFAKDLDLDLKCSKTMIKKFLKRNNWTIRAISSKILTKD